MPLLKIETSGKIAPDKKDRLAAAGSKILSEATGKPEKYAMVVLEDEATISMAGKSTAGAFCDVRGIGGLSKPVNEKITKGLCDLFKRELNIDPANVYVTFTDVAATNWGCNNSTFG